MLHAFRILTVQSLRYNTCLYITETEWIPTERSIGAPCQKRETGFVSVFGLTLLLSPRNTINLSEHVPHRHRAHQAEKNAFCSNRPPHT